MSTPDSFTPFRALPPELRLKIWSEALSARSVWAAVSGPAAGCDPDASRSPPVMAYVGPAPYLPGLACRESRRLLEKSYVKPLRGPESATSSGVYWVNLENTVVYLGNSSNAMDVMDAFGADKLSRFRHVALRWCQFGRLARACRRLATACPALRTIIIQGYESGSAANFSVCETLDPELAAYYTTIPDSVGPEISHETLDTPHFRSLLLEYFGDSPPRLHLVSPSSVNYSG